MMKIKTILEGPDIRHFISESWSNSWPMILIMFFEFLIGLTDIYIAGRIGRDVQASYGFVIQMYFVFIIIANALTTGTVSVISRLFTAGDKNILNNAIYSVIITTIIAGILFGVAGIFLTPLIVNFVNIPKELKPFAIPLGEIYAGGLLFHYILINTNGILRACKQVRLSLKTMSIVCAANIGINFLFLFYTNVGYKGIALATAISVCIGGILNLMYMKPFLRGTKTFSWENTKAIVVIGWPMGLGQGFWQLHSMVIYLILSALPRNSIETLAAFAAGLRIESAIFLPAMAFHMANAVIVGNLLGEDKKDDSFRAGIITAIMGVAIVSCLTLVVILGAQWIAPLLSKNTVVIAECVRYLYISMLSEPFMAFWLILGGALSGAGDTKGVMSIVVSCTWIIRIPLSYLFVIVLGFDAAAVWWMMNLSQLMTALFVVRRYWQRKWLQGTITV
jgi:MATE family multidrug resistance protein